MTRRYVRRGPLPAPDLSAEEIERVFRAAKMEIERRRREGRPTIEPMSAWSRHPAHAEYPMTWRAVQR